MKFHDGLFIVLSACFQAFAVAMLTQDKLAVVIAFYLTLIWGTLLVITQKPS